jgi:hypothetical protein
MKYDTVERTIENRDGSADWKRIVLRPLLLGLAFGAGCYVAKVIIECPLMSGIVAATVEGVKKSASQSSK